MAAYFRVNARSSSAPKLPFKPCARAPVRSHPRKGPVGERKRVPSGIRPRRRAGIGDRAQDRLHGRIPASGAPAPRCADPCSALRRPRRWRCTFKPVHRYLRLGSCALGRATCDGCILSSQRMVIFGAEAALYIKGLRRCKETCGWPTDHGRVLRDERYGPLIATCGTK